MQMPMCELFTTANIIQAALLGFSGAAIWLLNSKSSKARLCGGVIGIAAQPFWVLSFGWQQWGGLALVVWYTVAYLRGIRNNEVTQRWLSNFSRRKKGKSYVQFEERSKINNVDSL